MPLYVTAVRNSRSNKMFGRGVVASATLALCLGVLGASWSVRAGIVPGGLIWLAPIAANPGEEKTAATAQLSPAHPTKRTGRSAY